MATKPDLRKYEAALRTTALAYPETHEDFPWGERALKVKGKVFLFMYAEATKLALSVKLPDSRHSALMLPFTKPTGYGLGKAGWVSASIEAAALPPLEMLLAWLDESYRAVAPRTLVKRLDAQGGVVVAGPKAGKPTKAAAAAGEPTKAAAAAGKPTKAAAAAGKPTKAAAAAGKPTKAAGKPTKAAAAAGKPTKAAAKPTKAAAKPATTKATSRRPRPERRA